MSESSKDKRVVLIAVDGSDCAEYAFKYYAERMMRASDYVVLAYVPEVLDMRWASPSTADQTFRELKAKVEELKNKYETEVKTLALEGKFKTGEGKAGEVLCRIAHEEKASMIVIGSRGLGTVRRTILGSVSDYVIHHAEMPVLVCKLPAHHHQKK